MVFRALPRVSPTFYKLYRFFYNIHPVVQIITLKYKYKHKHIKNRVLVVSDQYIYVAVVAVEIKFIACLVSYIFVLIADHIQLFYFYFLWLCSPGRAMASWFTRFRDHTKRHSTVDRTPLDEWSARLRDFHLTTHTHTHTHTKQTSMSTVGFFFIVLILLLLQSFIFEPTIAVGERP
jgi:hypothetical protein